MSKTRTQNLKTVSTISTSLIATFDPVHNLHDLGGYDRIKAPSTDTGQERAPADLGMIIPLDMVANTLHRQLYGRITGRNGQSYDNIKERMDRYETMMQDHYQRYGNNPEAATADPRTYEIAYNLDIATARYEALKEFYDGVVATIEHFTQKKWEPRPMDGGNTAGKRVEITDELKAKALAALQRAAAKNSAVQ